MNVGSLFSGIGGLDLGLERAGMRIVWQVECDPYARAVLRKHWPNVPCYEDVREVGAEVGHVDVLAGGFPCQDISYAGFGAGLAGERSGLWREFARLIRILGPRYVVVENVAALLDRGMGEVLGTLSDLGFDAEWDVLPASAFGAYHERERVFLVAYDQGVGRDARHLLEAGGAERASLQHRRFHGGVVAQAAQGETHSRLGDEPRLDRLVHGFPAAVDRLRCLGNAVVPQVAEYIGRLILAHAEGSQMTTDCPIASEQAPSAAGQRRSR